ncbi:hypothetical protein ABZ357_11020 [Streptomyces sp. NPDC005917]|uniref:hypothetical protein n=1 Tax=unclassified Streptomyces TaxID=2593676 RepID=UPI0033C8E199
MVGLGYSRSYWAASRRPAGVPTAGICAIGYGRDQLVRGEDDFTLVNGTAMWRRTSSCGSVAPLFTSIESDGGARQ